jgi:hypothetical protein
MSSVTRRLQSRTECGGVVVLCIGVILACQSGASREAGAPADGGSVVDPKPIDGATPPETLCSRERDDAVRDVFCKDGSQDIRSLRDLMTRLDVAFPLEGSPSAAFSQVAILGHSTALSGELVSPLNPRVIIVGSSTLLAFNRGVQQVEIATRDRKTDRLNFFLVTFEQSCNRAPSGCTPGDLYTPRIESDWTNVRVEDDEDLKNTPSDCRQCHQRGRDAPILLMRERDGPWTHFFMSDQDDTSGSPEPTGIDLTRAYVAAKGDETYGAIPAAFLLSTVGFTLEAAVEPAQPLLFDSTAILNERWPWTPGEGYASEPVPSATWYRNYEAFKRGEQQALPHFDPMPTDPDKQAALSAAYQSYRAGETGAEDLPDLADIFPDDPRVRAELGLQNEPGATPAQALVQACGTCHNDVLDQSISRALFNIDLARMSRAELDVAIARLKAEPDAGVMPPPGERQLDPNARAQLIEYLGRNVRSSDDDALLGRAARLGMMKGSD